MDHLIKFCTRDLINNSIWLLYYSSGRDNILYLACVFSISYMPMPDMDRMLTRRIKGRRGENFGRDLVFSAETKEGCCTGTLAMTPLGQRVQKTSSTTRRQMNKLCPIVGINIYCSTSALTPENRNLEDRCWKKKTNCALQASGHQGTVGVCTGYRSRGSYWSLLVQLG